MIFVMVLIDSNVLIDVMTVDPRWSAWSGRALMDAADRAEIAINPARFASYFPTVRLTSPS